MRKTQKIKLILQNGKMRLIRKRLYTYVLYKTNKNNKPMQR